VAIMLFAAIEASRLLGFVLLADLVAQFTAFAGQVILGLIILAIGLYLANLAAKTVQASGVAQAGMLALAARISILVLAGAMALRQMGLANEIINLAFGLLLGAIAVAVALAFGLGGREAAARELEEWLQSVKSEKS
ncbi:MAG: mechanosensitive ion channel, partial [Anaerolineae bacterium]|nr:mechanosensitive ion channel [Anaerolineae bacterium]